MKFSGEIRVPGIDHPGVPAVFLIDDDQFEVVLEGESLGRWSLYDVRARRLVSSAFQVDLVGEEITFLADDPTDFAYRGVEHMAEVWARFKSMNVAVRAVAVRRSRKGGTPSNISGLREAMVENLALEHNGFLTGKESVRSDDITVEPAAPEMESLAVKEMRTLVTRLTVAKHNENQSLSSHNDWDAGLHRPDALQFDSLEAETRAIDEERARLEAEMQSLESERLEAEQMEADRVEAFRLEMERLESVREDQQRLEAKRSEASRQELERLQAEREEMERLAERRKLERLESERLEVAKAQAKLDQQRADMALVEAEREKSARAEQASIEKKRKEIERLDTERAERESLDAERRKAIEAEMEQIEAQRAGELRQEAERVEQERLEARKLEKERIRAEKAVTKQAEAERAEQERADPNEALDEGAVEETPPDTVEELISRSGGSDDSEGDNQLVIDLGEFEDPSTESEPDSDTDPQLEPALAGAPRQESGVMGAVKGAFSRGGRNHVHQFVEAPGGVGIGRSICEDCGYLSISFPD